MLRSRTLVGLVAAIAVPVWLWQRSELQHVISGSSSSPKSTIATTATETNGRRSLPSATVDSRPTFQVPVAQSPDKAANGEAPARAVQSAPLRLDVRVPASARVGDVVIITIDAQAFGGIRNLSFTVIYDAATLEFVSSSPGSFVQQASAPATLSAEDPSTGNVFVNMDITNGGLVASAGTVVVLQFNALNAGTSPITLRDVSFLESGRSRNSSAAIVRSASVAIEQG